MKGFALVVVLGVSSASWAQSFNIDMDASFGGPPLGVGVPDVSFGAAAGMAGRWNRVPVTNINVNQLIGLDGGQTQVRMVGASGGSGGGNNIPINTGDYALLLNDAREVDRTFGLSFKFTGLQIGFYEVYTYMVSITNTTQIRKTRVTIFESTGSQQRVLTGPMPGNQLIEGITHTKHSVFVSQGELNLFLESVEPNFSGWFNGIQVKQVVPEPTTLLATSIGLLTLLRQRRQRRVSS